MSDRETVHKLEIVWRSISELCSTLADRDWDTPTDCPGWSVKDQLSHIAGSESRLLGRSAPEHTPQDTSHVKNDIGQRNEVLVDWRRSWSGSQVLDDFNDATGERLKVLRGMTKADFDVETQTPIGPGTVRDGLQIRILDSWVHEQDIRRALGKPGHMQGVVVEHCVNRATMAMPYVVARKAGTPDGTTVVFEVTGAVGRVIAVGVEGSRGVNMSDVPADPDVRLSMDVETFMCLGCGRWEASKAFDFGRVEMKGDRTLGEAIISNMNFMI